MAVVVKPIALDDVGSFRRVLDSVARERRYIVLLEAPPLKAVKAFVRAAVEKKAVHLVAVEDREVIGWCDIHPRKKPGFTHVGQLGIGVRADYRNRGIGRRLLAAALDEAVSAGLIRVELEVFASNIHAIRLYRSLGFVEEGINRKARYLDGMWDNVVSMGWISPSAFPPQQLPPEKQQQSALLTRIEREAGIPELTATLARLQPSDLQSLLLKVYRILAGKRQPSGVLDDYRSSRFVRPGKVAPEKLAQWESLAFSQLPAEFEGIELSPVCPLGTSSVIAAVDQNWAVATVRNSEVVSDPTNVMALECALRRRRLLSVVPKSSQWVHLAGRHRVLRPQRYANSSMASHFSLFSLCSAGRDRGNRYFEMTALGVHLRFYVKLLRAFLGADRLIVISLSDFGAADQRVRLEKELLQPIREEFAPVVCKLDDQRSSGRGYYRDLCCKIHVESDSGELVEVADGGSVDWLQTLLSDSKERFVISGIGSERVCEVWGSSAAHRAVGES